MTRRNDIDLLKGIAIVAVILYHVGILPFGFLGVDCFLAVSGFLIIPKLCGEIINGHFSYFKWLFHRLYRIWPITLAASVVCLIIGYFVMIPDAYENLSESVVASNLFSNNILSAITTKNYWDTSNEYKPLMQMWYLGILAQFYVVFPALLLGLNKLIRLVIHSDKSIVFSLCIIGLLSLIIYCAPGALYTEKFYFLQYRLWEFVVGGLIGIFLKNKGLQGSTVLSVVAVCAIGIILCLNFNTFSQINNVTIIGEEIQDSSAALKMALTICVVVLTSCVLFKPLNNKTLAIVGGVGRASLSLFVWHQVILAFSRITLIDSFSWLTLIGYFIVTAIISYLSFKFIERIKLISLWSRLLFYAILVITTIIAFGIYRNAGVVRDVPELGISKSNPLVNRNTEYTDRVYSMDKPFVTEKIHVLVTGNSFARDFACILLEYDIEHRLEISYSYLGDVDSARVLDSDYIFSFGPKSKLPEKISKHISTECKVYGISTKSFGKDFGIFYNKRSQPGYLNQRIAVDAKCDSINHRWERSWGRTNFINLMDSIRDEDGMIPLFTPEGKVISFDCRHLTEAGCKFYASKINFDSIFK